MLTVAQLVDGPSTQQWNEDRTKQRWIPALPLPPYLLSIRLRDAWEVWKGTAQAIKQW